MWSFDKKKLLAELRRDMAERREAIATRQRQLDADRIKPKAPLIYKTIDDGRVRHDADAIDSASPGSYTDTLDFLQEQIDLTNQFAGNDRREIDAQLMALRAEVAGLKDRVSRIKTLVGSNHARPATADQRPKRRTST